MEFRSIRRWTRAARTIGVLLGLAVSANAAAQLVPGTAVWVGPEQTSGPNGESPCDYPTIQAAIADAFGGGEPPFTINLSQNYGHSGPIRIEQDVAIVGGYQRCGSTISNPPLIKGLGSPGRGQPLVEVDPGDREIFVTFRNVRLNGSLSRVPRGGVMLVQPGDAQVTLVNSFVSNGRAGRGGGIHLEGGGNLLTLIDTTIENNRADFGGGLSCVSFGVIDFQSGAIQDNLAQRQGGGVVLASGCELRGTQARRNRSILRNRVEDIQFGRGAGIFAIQSLVELGAPLSRTMIRQNVVRTNELLDGFPTRDESYRLHRYDLPGDNHGGGVAAEGSELSFLNVWFQGNEAADGGAIALVGDGSLYVDRSSATCDVSGSDCSVFEFNRARGGREGETDEGGDGAAIFAGPSQQGRRPERVAIYRSVIRYNAASCFQAVGNEQTGECNLNFDGLGAEGKSDSSVVRVDAQFAVEVKGNLVYGNDVGDDDDCNVAVCDKEGELMVLTSPNEIGRPLVSENTFSENRDADAVFSERFGTAGRGFEIRLVNNVIDESEVDELVNSGDFTGGDRIELASCNVTNFTDEMALSGAAIPIPNVDADPRFINPNLDDEPFTNFQLAPDSPAIDRCDDGDGLASLTYDLNGDKRAVDLSDGERERTRDAGAFERRGRGFPRTADLDIRVRSDLPKTVGLNVPHRFTIDVANLGRTRVGELTARVPVIGGGARIVRIAGAPTLSEFWDCSPVGVRCTWRSNNGFELEPGDRTSELYLDVAFAEPGRQTIIFETAVEDETIEELRPENNRDEDVVTVGPGADLKLGLSVLGEAEVEVGDTVRLFARVDNFGPTSTEGVAVRFGLPPGSEMLQLNDDSGDWSCDFDTAQCELAVPIEVLGVRGFSFDLRLDRPGAATVIAETPPGTAGDPDGTNNVDSADIQVGADLIFADGYE